ncbi:hypothetical protein B0H16DRAFT_1748260 [Mycena metata]|uniref:C2H2-type domain-containing protein n=1 Tax=Mycena metata TaxID=1033252 RepID=A0AAD7DZD0_9AGAR|nr:hypothetical protein B0H16DRAFT_1748260 [Mycena metata]
MPRRLPQPPDEMCSTCHIFSEFDDHYSCLTCLDHFCHTCVVRRHSSYPLHRIKRWDGFAYDNEITASSLGLSLHLAHGCTAAAESLTWSAMSRSSPVLISVGLIPSDIANELGAVELRLLFLQMDEEEERVEHWREEHRTRREERRAHLKPRVQPKLVLPPFPPRRRRRQPPPVVPPAPFTAEQQATWEAGWKDLPAIALAWSAGELTQEPLEDDSIPTFKEYLAQSAPPVPLRDLPGFSNFAEYATAGYVQLLAQVERLRKADEQRRKAWELLTSPMWQAQEQMFTSDWYRVQPRHQLE